MTRSRACAGLPNTKRDDIMRAMKASDLFKTYYPFSDKFKNRFWSNTKRSGSGCLEWQKFVYPSGYGAASINKHSIRAHRLAYMISRNSDPGDLFVCHSCDNPKCVEPSHLFLGTHTDNRRDCAAKGRTHRPIGALHGMAKLTADNVSEIRSRYASGETQLRLSIVFNVSNQQISRIVNFKTWRD